ncbi:MAG: S4 domain-containing protein YaaA [Streptococcaceae bacterium]|nr:S4 domain-containing protein YaaA [Streptococcaceae bacterium]
MQTFTLFDESIMLGQFLKEIGLISTGGAAKAFLAETEVFLNETPENRRGKKLFEDDVLEIPAADFSVTFVAATLEEIDSHAAELAEKQRVQARVKELNAKNKAAKTAATKKPRSPFHT